MVNTAVDYRKGKSSTVISFGSPESLMVPLIFAATEVPLPLIGQISEQKEFHRLDWPSVVATVNEGIEEFDFYFNFVLQEIEPLHSLWNK